MKYYQGFIINVLGTLDYLANIQSVFVMENIKTSYKKKTDTIKVEIGSKCHPFLTGKQKLVDTGGRVDKFNKRYGK